MLEFFTFPSASAVVASSTDYATTLITSFLPTVWVVLGVTAAVSAIMLLRKVIPAALRAIVGMRSRGGRRRR